jgi:hypothetical protein
MVNSFWAIKERIYYLYNRTGSAYVKTIYQESMFNTSLSHTKEKITFKDAEKLTSQTKIVEKLLSHLKSNEEKWFWEKASQVHRNSLILAFHLRDIQTHDKIPNLETEDWTKNPLFLEMYEKLISLARWRKIREPSNMIEAMIRSQGKHFRNLRFGHIHLTLDVLENRSVWGIHWDSSTIKTLDAREILTHWLEDDMPS